MKLCTATIKLQEVDLLLRSTSTERWSNCYNKTCLRYS